MFWNVPEKDLNTEIKRVWEDTVKKIRNNEYDNLPKISESPILHVRPHARNAKDTYPTLDGKKALSSLTRLMESVSRRATCSIFIR